MDGRAPGDRHGWPATAAGDVLAGQVAFFTFTALCVALHPGFVLKANEGGISNYGIHLKTVIPYSLAFATPSVMSLRAARRLHVTEGAAFPLRGALRLYAALLVTTLVTTYPYSLNDALKDLHDAVGVAVVVFEMVTGALIVRALHRGRAVLAVEFAGFVVGAITFVGAWHLLFVAQIVTGVAFAVILVTATQSWQ